MQYFFVKLSICCFIINTNNIYFVINNTFTPVWNHNNNNIIIMIKLKPILCHSQVSYV